MRGLSRRRRSITKPRGRENIRRLLHVALFALPLLAAPVITTVPASAAVDFSISLGNAAFGYADGYWDRDHHWHAWHNRAEARYFRDHNRDHYAEMRHNRVRDQGWRDERWWEQERDHDRDHR